MVPTVQAAFHTLAKENSYSVSFPTHVNTGVFLWKSNAESSFRMRTKHNNTWSSWQNVDEDHDGLEKDENNTHYSQMLFFDAAESLEISFLDKNTPSDITFLSFQEDQKFSFQTPVKKASASDTLSIVSREQWGADPAWIEEETWQVERAKVCVSKPQYCGSSPAGEKAVEDKAKKLQEDYPEDTKIEERITALNGKELHWAINKSATIKKIFVHHTAELSKDINNDGVIDQKDEQAVMRNTYYFHSLVRGWGDIGYNYVVGQTGTIYEGRAGGDKVVGAHAVWRNISSVGVSTMGNFEEEDILSPQFTGLANIVGYVANKYNLNPEGSTIFYGKDGSTILGHKDSPEASTACPGKNLYDKLPDLRKLSSLTLHSPLGIENITTTTITPVDTSKNGVGVSFIPLENSLTFKALEEKELQIQVKNTGTATWEKGTALQIQNLNPTLFDIKSGNKTPAEAYITTESIPAGKTLSAKIIMQAKYIPTKDSLSLSLLVNKKYQSTALLVPFTIQAPLLQFEVNSVTQAKTELIFNEESKSLAFIKNTGNTAWEKNSISLQIQDKNTVGIANGNGMLREERIEPNGIGTFEIPMKAPTTAGNFTLSFIPFIEGTSTFQGTAGSISGQVLHPLKAKNFTLSQKNNTTTALSMGETKIVDLQLQNTSSVPWTGLSKMDLEPKLAQNSPYIIPATVLHFEKDYLNPGEIGTISIPVRAGYQPLSSTPSIELNYLGLSLLKAPIVLPITISDAALSGSFTNSKSTYTKDTLEITVKNTGTANWKKEHVFLGLSNTHSSLWESSERIVTFDNSDTIAPGETAHFTLPWDASLTAIPNKEWVLSFEQRALHVTIEGNLTIKNSSVGTLALPEFGTYLQRLSDRLTFFQRF